MSEEQKRKISESLKGRADHLNRNKRDNRPENLVPSCHTCNITRIDEKVDA
ncbi:hypothetical protein SEA_SCOOBYDOOBYDOO_83 [Mycobacterium phage ScoobyDoobyDoo]|nr:hypothetical protein SEA_SCOOBYDOOBYDOO_83 [Mycobacterium phage ScoobyDoobyDoo]